MATKTERERLLSESDETLTVQEQAERRHIIDKLYTGKPGRPATRRYHMEACGGSRNSADMTRAVVAGRIPIELVKPCDTRDRSITTLAYLARLPAEDRESMLALFDRLGARGSKRFMECISRPPSRERIAELIYRMACREFPSVPFASIIDGMRDAIEMMEGERDGDESTTPANVVRAILECQRKPPRRRKAK